MIGSYRLPTVKAAIDDGTLSLRLYPSTRLSLFLLSHMFTTCTDGVSQLMRQYSAMTVENFYLSLETE